MDRVQYIKALKKRLSKLPHEEFESVIQYYEEYFDEAGSGNEQKVITELGTPEKLASVIKVNYAVRDMEKSGSSAKKSLKAIFIVILAIFASPVAIPVAILIFCCLLAIVISMLAVFISIFVSGIAVAAGGILAVVAALFVIFQSPATSIFFIGFGLVSMAAGAALFIITAYVSKVLFRWIANAVSKLIVGREKK